MISTKEVPDPGRLLVSRRLMYRSAHAPICRGPQLVLELLVAREPALVTVSCPGLNVLATEHTFLTTERLFDTKRDWPQGRSVPVGPGWTSLRTLFCVRCLACPALIMQNECQCDSPTPLIGPV